MQMFNEAADQKIIGEAAYSLLSRHEKVTLATLMSELAEMAQQNADNLRQQHIREARHWLMTCRLNTQAESRHAPPGRNLFHHEDSVAVAAGFTPGRRH